MPKLRQNTVHNHCTVVSKFVSHKGGARDSETMYVSMSAEQMSRYDVDDGQSSLGWGKKAAVKERGKSK